LATPQYDWDGGCGAKARPFSICHLPFFICHLRESLRARPFLSSSNEK